jgi:hypothetical protein
MNKTPKIFIAGYYANSAQMNKTRSKKFSG